MARRRDPNSTRRRILVAAFREFRQNGFRTADMRSILTAAGVTKGALYHHFQSKQGLGYAVIEGILREWILDRWLVPIVEAADPLDELARLARWGESTVSPTGLALGCPLNTLAQELSAVDEGYRQRLADIYREWRTGLADSLSRAQKRGAVHPQADVEAAATFLVAIWEGSIGLAKAERDPDTLSACRQGLEDYLRTLRP